MRQIIAQAIGIPPFLLGLWAFCQKDDVKFNQILGFASLVLALHYALVGATAGALIAGANFIRSKITDKKSRKRYAPLFLLYYWVIAFIIYEQPTDLLPMLSSSFGLLALFFFTGITMRLVMYFPMLSWLVYSIVEGALGGILTESLFIIMNTKTIWQLHQQGRINRMREAASHV